MEFIYPLAEMDISQSQSNSAPKHQSTYAVESGVFKMKTFDGNYLERNKGFQNLDFWHDSLQKFSTHISN